MAPRAASVPGAPPKRRAQYLTPSLTSEEVRVLLALSNGTAVLKADEIHVMTARSELIRWVVTDGSR